MHLFIAFSWASRIILNRRNIQEDHRLQVVDLLVKEFSGTAQTGIIHERGDGGIGAQTFRYALHVLFLGQVGHNCLNPAASGLQSCGGL